MMRDSHWAIADAECRGGHWPPATRTAPYCSAGNLSARLRAAPVGDWFGFPSTPCTTLVAAHIVRHGKQYETASPPHCSVPFVKGSFILRDIVPVTEEPGNIVDVFLELIQPSSVFASQ